MTNSITFGTLQKNGVLTNVKEVKQSVFAGCPFTIFLPSHYREDGTCKCSNKEHRKLMIREWEYTKKDFKNIPLID